MSSPRGTRRSTARRSRPRTPDCATRAARAKETPVTAMLDVRRLIMLRAVAAEGSIAGAARRLRYTRPTVSQQVSALEAEAGTALIDRSGNRITLTAAGRNLVEHAERILVELRAAEASLTPGAARFTGPLRVGIPFREGPQIMSRALSDLRRLYPDLEL